MITLNGRDLCENCFHTISKYETSCPHCGYSQVTAGSRQPLALPISTILMGKYIVGKVLGMGGFGITYLSYDVKAGRQVAIKEYYPTSLASRYPGGTELIILPGEKGQDFKKGSQKFYEEAQLISNFNGNPNIINVYEFFYQNNTAYYVMEYLDGEDLAHYLKAEGKGLSEGKLLYVLDKVTDALMIVHRTNTLHRDITPDNIFVTTNGTIKLIDFGAARHYMTQESQNFSVILKEGFAPIEQYQKNGRQGPWTDIYALGATSYYLLTGKKPLGAFDRMQRDTVDFSCATPALSGLLRSMMAIPIEKRPQNMYMLKASLQKINVPRIPLMPSKGSSARPTPIPIPIQRPQPKPNVQQPAGGQLNQPPTPINLQRQAPQPIHPAPGPTPSAPQPIRPSQGQGPRAPQPIRPSQGQGPQAPQPIRPSQGQNPQAPQPIKPSQGQGPQAAQPIRPSRGQTPQAPQPIRPFREAEQTKPSGNKKKLWIPIVIITAILAILMVILATCFSSNELDYTLVGEDYYVSGRGFCSDDYIVIPSSYKGKDVVGISEFAFSDDTKLTAITLPRTVKYIGDDAFRGCTNLSRINMSENLVSIGSYAFCETKIGSIVIPKGVTSIGKHAFYNCEELSSVEYLAQDCNARWYDKKTSLNYDVFYGCPLNSVNIGKSVKKIPTMLFHNASGTFVFTSVSFPAEVSVIEMGAFKNCYKLKTMSFDVAYGNGIERIEQEAFAGCSGMKTVKYFGSQQMWDKVDINANNYGLTIAEITFSQEQADNTPSDPTAPAPDDQLEFTKLPDGTYSITAKNIGDVPEQLTLPSTYNGKKVTKIGVNAFADCTNLKAITIPNSIKTIEDAAFVNCTNLENVSISDGVTTIGVNAFAGCESLKNITVPGSVATIDDSAFASCTNLENVSISDGVTTIGNASFAHCTSLQSITIPKSVNNMGSSAFGGCTALSSIVTKNDLTDWSSDTFNGCTNLKDLYFIQGGAATYPGSMFPSNAVSYFYKETKPTTEGNYWHYVDGVPTKWDSIPVDDVLKFTQLPGNTCSVSVKNKQALPKNLVIPSTYNGKTVTHIADEAFYDCDTLISVSIPSSITHIGKKAFAASSFLSEITLGNGLVSIGDEAFYACASITSITIPNKVQTISSGAFRSCSELEKVSIGSSVTTIKDNAFADCAKLESIILPTNVLNIGNGAFNNTVIYYDGSDLQWSNVYTGGSSLKSTVVMYRSDSKPDSESACDYWHYVSGTPTAYYQPTPDKYFTFTKNSDGTYTVSPSSAALPSEIILPSHHNSVPVTSVSSFKNCTNIKKIVIPDSVKTITDSAFKGCTGLTNVVIGNNVTSISNYAFLECTKLPAVTIPEKITYMGWNVFEGCKSLSTVNYNAISCSSDGYTVQESDGSITVYSIFANSPLQYVNIGPNVQKIPTGLFIDVSESPAFLFTNITIPNRVTVIEAGAFKYCRNLQILNVGKGVQIIEPEAFSDCPRLVTINYAGTAYQWTDIVISDNNGNVNRITPYYNQTQFFN